MIRKMLVTALALGLFATAAVAQTPPPVAKSPAGYPQAIIRGDYPDPSILRDGADYYMIHSEYNYAPSFLIWHSTDLIHWAPIARALPEGTHAYAPDLTRINGKFYIYYPAGGTNWVTTADTIRGPWTKPVDLKIAKIDPGHVVGEDGKQYLFTSGGHMTPLSDDGMAAAGPTRDAYAGWVYPSDWKTECMCLESPKLVKRGDYFYLISAEGGTAGPATSHMAVAARSKSVNGPWENSPYNPIVHTYSADEDWWSKGHGTLIDDVNGNWWIVYHAYEKGLYTLGRATLIDPIDWTPDGWPVLAKVAHPLPGKPSAQDLAGMPLSDTFSGNTLGLQWMGIGNLDGILVGGGKLHIEATGATVPTARKLMITAQDAHYQMQVEMDVAPGATGGLTMIYNDKAFAGLTADGDMFTVYRSATDSTSQPNRYGRHLWLRIDNDHEKAALFASRDGKHWDELASGVDVSGMNHNVYHGFLALRPTLTASGTGEVTFDNFEYRALK